MDRANRQNWIDHQGNLKPSDWHMNISSSQPSLSVARILVVDDVPDNCILLQTLLESEGYQVEVADSGYAALDCIAVNPPSLVLLDVMMLEMSGLEVVQRVWQDRSLLFIPIVLVTGYSEAKPAEGFNVGADGFIRKPIDFDLLLNQVRAILQ